MMNANYLKYFPTKFNNLTSEIYFIETNVDELKNFPFHDDRFSRNKKIIKKQKFNEIVDFDSQVSFVFHTSFCGSTFLAKLLGETGGFCSIREPEIFSDLSNKIRVNSLFINDKELTKTWIKRSIASFMPLRSQGELLLVKPTNVANNLIPYIIDAFPSSRMVLLYGSLEGFLLSILKKGEKGKAFVRKLYNVLTYDESPFVLEDFRLANSYTDLQIACLVWCMQASVYSKLTRFNNIRFLDADSFLNKQRKTLRKVSNFLGYKLSKSRIKELSSQGVFDIHSKLKVKFSLKKREKENLIVREKYKNEIDEILLWSDSVLAKPNFLKSNNHLLD